MLGGERYCTSSAISFRRANGTGGGAVEGVAAWASAMVSLVNLALVDVSSAGACPGEAAFGWSG